MESTWLTKIALAAAFGMFAFTIAGCLAGWMLAIARISRGEPLIPFEPRRPVPWGLVAIIVSIVGLLAATAVLVTIASKSLTPIAQEPTGNQDSTGGHEASAVGAIPVNAIANRSIAKNTLANQRPGPRPSSEPANLPSLRPNNENSNQPPNNALVSNQPGAKKKGANYSITAIWINSLINFSFVGLVLAVLRGTGANWDDVGASLTYWKRDIVAGVLGFCMIAPAIFFLQWWLVQSQPSVHPLIEFLKRNMTLGSWLAVVFAAVIAAPWFEEFLFRVLIQGWLERVFDQLSTTKTNPQNNHPPSANFETSDVVADSNPYESPAAGLRSPPASDIRERDIMPALFWGGPTMLTPPSFYGDLLPILITSLVFALLHFSHGPDWIPLIPFAILLGFLYRRTHRIWPSLIAHLMLNAFSMTMLTLSLLKPESLFPGQ